MREQLLRLAMDVCQEAADHALQSVHQAQNAVTTAESTALRGGFDIPDVADWRTALEEIARGVPYNDFLAALDLDRAAWAYQQKAELAWRTALQERIEQTESELKRCSDEKAGLQLAMGRSVWQDSRESQEILERAVAEERKRRTYYEERIREEKGGMVLGGCAIVFGAACSIAFGIWLHFWLFAKAMVFGGVLITATSILTIAYKKNKLTGAETARRIALTEAERAEDRARQKAADQYEPLISQVEAERESFSRTLESLKALHDS